MKRAKNVRTIITLPVELHQAVRMLATARYKSMNAVIVQALRELVEARESVEDVQHFVEHWKERSLTGEGLEKPTAQFDEEVDPSGDNPDDVSGGGYW